MCDVDLLCIRYEEQIPEQQELLLFLLQPFISTMGLGSTRVWLGGTLRALDALVQAAAVDLRWCKVLKIAVWFQVLPSGDIELWRLGSSFREGLLLQHNICHRTASHSSNTHSRFMLTVKIYAKLKMNLSPPPRVPELKCMSQQVTDSCWETEGGHHFKDMSWACPLREAGKEKAAQQVRSKLCHSGDPRSRRWRVLQEGKPKTNHGSLWPHVDERK